MSRANPTPPQASAPPTGTPLRLWGFRILAAVGLPLLFLLLLEGGLRVGGYGRPAGFLIPDAQPGWYRTNPDFLHPFMPAGFDLRPLSFRVAARKPANTLRIVVLGESAAKGLPAPEFGFAPQLRAQLRARFPGRDIEVLNTGIAGINSHVVYRIARDMADFSPDLFIVYMGNNEVVGPYGPGCTYLSAMPPLWVIRLSVWVRSTRTGQLLGALADRLGTRGRTSAWGGMAMFADSAVAGDDPRLEAAYRNFSDNLRDIVTTATEAGAKTLLCTVVANLKDCAPMVSLHRPGLTAAELAAWDRAFQPGVTAWRLGEDGPARAALEEALRLDPHHAGTLFLLGNLALRAGDTAAARQLLVAAQHWDALRFRPDPRINAAVRQIAREMPGVRLLDAAMTFGSDPASSAPVAGRELLFEHVHLNWEGNYRLAAALAAETGAALPGPGPDRPAGLSSAAVAAALGYSTYEESVALGLLIPIVSNPPFTNQLTYCEDQARLAHELVRLQTESRTPAGLRSAQDTARRAAASDPDNPMLAKIEADLDAESGDLDSALAATRRARVLQPDNVTPALNEALILSRLGRFTEAEARLQAAEAAAGPRDAAELAPAFADLYLREKRPEEARRHLEAAITRHPEARILPWWRARVEQSAGDAAAAERAYRAVLAADPGNREALEFLVSLLAKQGRTHEVDDLTLAAADQQPRNQANNRRAALLAEARGDAPRTIRYLLAVERCGPVTAAFEMHLARKFFEQGRRDETLDHLGVAWQLAPYENDPQGQEVLRQVIAKVRARVR